MKTTLKISGLRKVEAELAKVKGQTAKNKTRKVLRDAAKPVAERMAQLAPRDEGDLVESISYSTVLNRSQRREQRKGEFAEVEMHIGPSGLTQGITQEFGTWFHSAQPFARPAWDSMQGKTLQSIVDGLEMLIIKGRK